MTRFYSSTAQPTTLSAACTNSATSIQVTATTGFPAVEFILALDYGTASQELVKVTNVAGTTLTVVRGFDSTAAQAHSLGAAVQHVHSADDFRLSRTHEAASTGVHGVAGAVVGTTDTQALSNKDLTAGTNTFPSSLATDAEVSSAVSTHAGLTATHGATGAVVGTTNTQTLTNKTIDLGSNTVTMTKAQLNAAVTDADVATLTGTETLTNKTLTSPTINGGTLSGLTITGVGELRYARKAADESVTSSTTLQDDDALTFTVAASAVYELVLNLQVNPGGNGAGGITAALEIPTGATFDMADTSLQLAGAAGGTTIYTATGPLAAKTMRILITVSTTAGSATFKWAQTTSSATATKVLTGSWATIRRVA